MIMDKNTLKSLAINIALLMNYHKQSQEQLAKKSGVAQRTICNMLKPGATKKGPTIENIAAVAESYDLETWHLLVPNQPIEVLTNKCIEHLINNYNTVDEGGRKNLNRISEKEVVYCSQEHLIKKTANE